VPELRAWMTDMVASRRVRVTPGARQIARTVLYPNRLLPRVAWDAAHLISLSTLPDPIRREYGIGWSERRERGVERLASLSRRVLPLVPPPLRYVPHARTAERRVRRAARP
jgi:uncharacterized protein (DUF2236 family)